MPQARTHRLHIDVKEDDRASIGTAAPGIDPDRRGGLAQSGDILTPILSFLIGGIRVVFRLSHNARIGRHCYHAIVRGNA